MVLALSVHGPLSFIAFGLSIIMHPGRKNTVEEKWQIAGKKKWTGRCQIQDILFKGTFLMTDFFSQAHFSNFMICQWIIYEVGQSLS